MVNILSNEISYSPEEEVTDDLIQIITVFSSRLYGLRSYKSKEKVKKKVKSYIDLSKSRSTVAK